MKISRSNLLPLLMLFILVFQVSVIPDTLGVKLLTRLVNASILVLFVFWVFLKVNRQQSKSMLFFFTAPCLLVLVGFGINFVLALSPSSLGQASKLIPWLALLVVPFHRNADIDAFWRCFHLFIFYSILISLFEYVAVFSGYLSPTVIETDRGVFFKGVISIFHYLEGGIIYYRFYGIFPEPGTTAMFILPALVYALLYKKYVSVVVFMIAMVLTASLGGAASLLVTLFLFSVWKTSKKTLSVYIARFLVVVSSIAVVLIVLEDFSKAYEQKNLSASVREGNVTNFINNIGDVMMNNPLGFVLEGKSMSELSEDNDNYLGSNFALYSAFVQGGVFSLIGYTMFFFLNVAMCILFFHKRIKFDKTLACAMISLPGLLLFCFQRTTILETALYAFLFAIPLIRLIDYRKFEQSKSSSKNTEEASLQDMAGSRS